LRTGASDRRCSGRRWCGFHRRLFGARSERRDALRKQVSRLDSGSARHHKAFVFFRERCDHARRHQHGRGGHVGRIIKDAAERTRDEADSPARSLSVSRMRLKTIRSWPARFTVWRGGSGDQRGCVRTGRGPLRRQDTRQDLPLQDLAETIKKLSFKLSRAGELVGREAARRLGFRLASSICRWRPRRFRAIQWRTSSKRWDSNAPVHTERPRRSRC
jgi:hypothetical protein